MWLRDERRNIMRDLFAVLLVIGKMLIKNCLHGFEGTIDLLSNDEQITLKIALDALNLHFGEDVISAYLNDIDSLKRNCSY